MSRSMTVMLLCAATLSTAAALPALVTNVDVDVDAVPPTLTLEGFGFGAVQGAGQAFIAVDANISSLPILLWSDAEVQADLTSVMPLAPGGYLVAVDPDAGVIQLFDATVGAVGPPGPDGPEGPPGAEASLVVVSKTCLDGRCSCDGTMRLLNGGADCFQAGVEFSYPWINEEWFAFCGGGNTPEITINCYEPSP